MSVVPAACGTCGAEWSGTSPCHCGGCHSTFAGLTLFDLHRHQRGDRGGCLDPNAITNNRGEPSMFFRDGMWRGPEMTEEQKLARFGTK